MTNFFAYAAFFLCMSFPSSWTVASQATCQDVIDTSNEVFTLLQHSSPHKLLVYAEALCNTELRLTKLFPAVMHYQAFLQTEAPNDAACIESTMGDLLETIADDPMVHNDIITQIVTSPQTCRNLMFEAFDALADIDPDDQRRNLAAIVPSQRGNLRGLIVWVKVQAVAFIGCLAIMNILVIACNPADRDNFCTKIGQEMTDFFINLSNAASDFFNGL